jgi:hypothetical protein
MNAVRVALFVNRMVTLSPDDVRDWTVARSSTPLAGIPSASPVINVALQADDASTSESSEGNAMDRMKAPKSLFAQLRPRLVGHRIA